MSPEEALEQINAQEHTTFKLETQFSGGEDQGAFLVIGTDGARAVLKLSRNPMWLNQIKRAKAGTDHLKALGYPVPVYGAMGSTDRGTFWLQSELTGSGVETPTADQVAQILKLIELQKGQAISDLQGQDWVWYMTDVVFQGESGNVRSMMQFGPLTSALVADVEALVVGLQSKALPKSDLVHGDLNLSQIMFKDQTVSGVLDWDQVGYGDRTIDLVSLWYSLLHAPDQSKLVMDQMLQVSDTQAIKIFTAYKIMAVVAWHINKVGGEVVAVVSQARTALEQLKALQ